MKNKSAELKLCTMLGTPVGAAIHDKSNATTQAVGANGQDCSAIEKTDELREIIAQAAYNHSQLRRFELGFELEDWLAAEREVAAICNAILKKSRIGVG